MQSKCPDLKGLERISVHFIPKEASNGSLVIFIGRGQIKLQTARLQLAQLEWLTPLPVR